ncbi:unnamed protein product, partial [Symbiodinium sp. KB8]
APQNVSGPVLQMLTPSEVLLGPREEKHLYVKMLTPLVASGATPVGVKGWVPPVRSGETSDRLEMVTEKLQDSAVIGIAVSAGRQAAQQSRPRTTRATGVISEKGNEMILGRTERTLGRQDEKIGNANTEATRMETTASGAIGEDATPPKEGRRWMVETDGELDTIHQSYAGIPRRMVEMDVPVGTIPHAIKAGKWEPKAEDLWYTKLEEENQYVGNTKVGEFLSENTFGKGGQGGHGARASERLQVPSFNAEDSEDLGGSARSYLRQIEAWKRMTMLPASKQALVLYQNLSGKAWIAAEELSLARLGEDTGVAYLVSWVTARFLDLEITRIGRALSDFFRKLRRRPTQSVREYNTEYDRLYGNSIYLRAWVTDMIFSVFNKQPFYMIEDYPEDIAEDDGIPEEVAQAWVTFRSAKDKYKGQQRARGYQGDSEKNRDPEQENTLKQMKMKSFCSGCGNKTFGNHEGSDKTRTQWLQTYADAIAEHG